MVLRSVLAAVALLAGAASSLSAQESLFILDSLVVTASPSPRAAGDVGRSVTVLEGAAMRAQGLSFVADALRDVLGLTLARSGSWGAASSVFLRGGESDHVLVLMDGVRVNQPGGAFDFSGLTLDNVERIEIVRGPASSLYGSDAVAGVIQIITRTGRGSPRWSLSAGAGTFGRRDAAAQVEAGSGEAGWSLSVTRLRGDGVLRLNNGFENTVLAASVRLAPDASTRASVALRASDRTYHFPTDGAGAITDLNAFTFGDETSLAVTASRLLTDRLELRSAVTIARGDGGTDDRADSPADTLGGYAFASLDHTQRATADLRASFRTGPLHSTAGIELERQRQRSFSESRSQWGPSVGRSDHRRDNRAAYTHMTARRGAWALAGGARVEDNERFGRFVTWNAELAWHPRSGLRVRASAGRGVKEPSFFENFAEGWVRGNPDLRPERSRALDAGIEQALAGGRATVAVSVFHQRLADLVEYVAHPAAPTDANYVNVGAAVARGLEASVEGRLGRFSGGADWNWLHSEVVRGGGDVDESADFVPGARLLRRPAHSAGAHGSVRWGTSHLRMDARVTGARDDRDFSGWPARRLTLPRYAVVDAAIEVPVKRARFFVRVENFLDARYDEVAGFPAPGRSLRVGGSLSVGGT